MQNQTSLTRCKSSEEDGQGVKLTSLYAGLKSTLQKKRASFRKNQKIGSDFTKYENKHQEK